MSKKDKRPSFSFSNENTIGYLEEEYFFCFIERGKKYKYIIDIRSIEDTLRTKRAIFDLFIFKNAYKNIS